MTCKNCGTEILRGKFCPGCGTKISEEPSPPPQEVRTDAICASCNAPLKPGAKFCRACGARPEAPPVVPEESSPVVPENLPVPEPEPEPEKKPDKSGNKKILAFVVAAALLLAAGFGFWFFYPRNGLKTVVPSSLVVTTNPGNVHITLDGQPIGTTDDSGNLLYEEIEPGRYEVTARRDNYKDAKQKLEFISGEQQTAEFFLNPLAASLLLTTNPGNAYISLDGQPIGMTDYSGNLLYEDVEPGRHEVAAHRDNYTDAKQNLEFAAGEQQTAQLILNQIAVKPSPDPKQNLESKDIPLKPTQEPAKTKPVAADNKPVGGAGVSIEQPPVETAKMDGYAEPEQDEEFASDEQYADSLDMNLPTGSLSVNVNTRNADIRIRGAGVLETHSDRLSSLTLPVGSYTITVSKSGYRSATRTATIRANSNTNISVALESAYAGPMSGVMVWTGDVRGATMVTIEDGKASTGRVTGSPLPGVPCSILLSDFRNVAIAYAPGPESDYKRVVLQVNSKGRVSVQLRWSVIR